MFTKHLGSVFDAGIIREKMSRYFIFYPLLFKITGVQSTEYSNALNRINHRMRRRYDNLLYSVYAHS